ncbi:hypothetical protein K443DRAFT_679937 [Laccaria amethystina LaAM-08-1]|uniref:Uncharacterized protein n=1 Tax=Laccaria amethystina LaAM-08-1 TaxID=1095629 RepID=A0A0C9WNW9_9AGAR|nr:hypothetical protein K443DRAFT_679937 [Laccaria amethystina LaAM-08-1]
MAEGEAVTWRWLAGVTMERDCTTVDSEDGMCRCRVDDVAHPGPLTCHRRRSFSWYGPKRRLAHGGRSR